MRSDKSFQNETISPTNREQYSSYFKQLWPTGKPIVKLFQTTHGHYLYDPGTNKILGCETPVNTLVEKLTTLPVEQAIDETLDTMSEAEFLSAAQKVAAAIETQKVLLTSPEDMRFLSDHFIDLDKKCETTLGQMILETTESCNLRCEYCIYNAEVQESREHGTDHMDQSTAFAAIDYLAAHSSEVEEASITFYGGEPLLRFPFIKACVDYSKKARKGKGMRFSLTTNGTLITPEIAEFFANENFSVNVSIDGPQEIHDDYRIDVKGKGTFQRAMRGLKTVVDAFGKRKGRLNLTMVYAPPFSEKKLERITQLWDEYPWLDGITASISYPHAASVPPHKVKNKKDLIEDKNLIDWAHQKYIDDYTHKRKSHPLVKEMVFQAMIKIFRRLTYDEPKNSIHLNGCCVPGARKIYASVDGNLSLCERVHKDAPSLGNVQQGVDFDKMKKTYVDEYADKSIALCSRCWANRFCGVCYIDTYTDGTFDLKKKNYRCKSVLSSVERGLRLYVELLRIDPEGLNYLADIDVT